MVAWRIANPRACLTKGLQAHIFGDQKQTAAVRPLKLLILEISFSRLATEISFAVFAKFFALRLCLWLSC